jgi:ABC-type proline/glycine betaine transport system permease subunit
MLSLWDFLDSHFDQIAFSSWQHVSLAAQCLVLATIVAVAVIESARGIGMGRVRTLFRWSPRLRQDQ